MLPTNSHEQGQNPGLEYNKNSSNNDLANMGRDLEEEESQHYHDGEASFEDFSNRKMYDGIERGTDDIQSFNSPEKDRFESKFISKNPLLDSNRGGEILYDSQRKVPEQMDLHKIEEEDKQELKKYKIQRYENKPDKRVISRLIKETLSGQQGKVQEDSAQQRGGLRKKLPPLPMQTSSQLPKSLSRKKLTKMGAMQEDASPKKLQKLLYPRPTVSAAKMSDPHTFISQILSPHQMFQGVLQRENNCCSGVQYSVYMAEGLKLVMSSKKKSMSMTSSYAISSSESNFDQNSQEYVGNLVSNFSGSIFNMYDNGYHPETAVIKYPNRTVRKLLATIFYEAAPSISSQPRTITVYILKRPYKYLELKGTEAGKEEISLKELYDLHPEDNRNKIYKATNKKPVWNERKKAYVMNLYGKMGESSVKNMILIGEDDREIMLFAKNQTNRFHIDVAYPLQPKVALGIILSSFDFKLICE